MRRRPPSPEFRWAAQATPRPRLHHEQLFLSAKEIPDGFGSLIVVPTTLFGFYHRLPTTTENWLSSDLPGSHASQRLGGVKHSSEMRSIVHCQLQEWHGPKTAKRRKVLRSAVS
ncbi:uncharacterized protein LOC144373967 [Ictidomys tridecemlineatus]